MSVKSIIDIDINDERFKAFAKLFQKYQEQLEKTPEVWEKVNEHQEKSVGLFQAMVAAQLARDDLSKRMKDDQEELEESSERTGRVWEKFARNAKSTASSMKDITISILKWTSITSVMSGLLGAGGLFGITRLAQGVASGRRASLGLGLGYGEMTAFQTNFNRVVNADSFLGGVNEALHDASKRSSLYGAGLTENQIRGRSTGDVAADLIPRLKALVDRTPDSLLAQMSQARGLDQFVTLEDLVRLKRTPASELKSYSDQYRRDSKDLGLQVDIQQKWQNLSIQLDRAGLKIETVLVKGLTPLAPVIEKLSDSFAKSLGTLISSDTFQNGIKNLGAGIEVLAKYIGSPNFQKDIKNLVEGIGDVATAMVRFARWFLGKKSPEELANEKKAGFGFGDREDWEDRYQRDQDAKRRSSYHRASQNEATRRFENLENKYRLPSGLLQRVYQKESHSGDPRFLKSGAGAEGPFQFMPGTAKTYGLKDPYDFNQSSDASARYYRDLLLKFGGNVEKAAAAYNYGPGNIDRLIRKYGDSWKNHLPSETKGYVQAVAPGGGNNRSPAPPTVKVVIENKSGGNVVASAAQVAR